MKENCVKSAVRLALAETNKNKAVGPNELVIKICSVLDDFGINKIAEMINR